MALQSIPGGLWFPRPIQITAFASAIIDATGEKIAFVGPVSTPNQGSKSIRKVGFRFGTVTKAGGSALTVSLQDVDLAAGQPMRPDGTQDQTVAIANADAAFASNTWIQTGNLSADRTVTHGELLAVVVEFDGAGRLGADSVAISVPNTGLLGHSALVLFTGSWVATAATGVLLEFSDGTFGTLEWGYPISNVATHNFHVNTAGADEYGIEFQVPWECAVDGAWWQGASGGTAGDFEVILYSGTTPMTNGTISVDGHTLTSGSTFLFQRSFPGAITLAANTSYKLALRPTATTGFLLHYVDVAAAGYMAALDGGTNIVQASRLDQGAWAAATTTRRPLMGLKLCAFHDGAAGGGPVGHGRLSGGLQ